MWRRILTLVAALVLITGLLASSATAVTLSPPPPAPGPTKWPPDFELNNDYTQIRLDDRVYTNYTKIVRYRDGRYFFTHETGHTLMNPVYQSFDYHAVLAEFQKLHFIAGLEQLAQQYPEVEVVLINGKPWQDTEFADVILSNIPPQYREFARDKANNGHAYEVLVQGLSVAEARQRSTDHMLWVNKQYLYRTGEDFARDGADYDRASRETVAVPLSIFLNWLKNGTAAKALELPAAPTFRVELQLNSPVMKVTGYPGLPAEWTWELPLDVPPIAPRGRTLLPTRTLFEALGTSVAWLPATRQVRISDPQVDVLLTVDSKEAVLNYYRSGKTVAVTLDEAPQIYRNRVMIPLRFVSETLGWKVDWAPETGTIVIEATKAL